MHDVLYIDGDHGRQRGISQTLVSAGLSVETVPTLDGARALLATNPCRLVLVHLPSTDWREVSSFCSYTHMRDSARVLMVLMDEPCVCLETHLFDCGVSDVVAGVQTCPELLAKRIKIRLRTSRAIASRRGEVTLGDTVVDFSRCEVRRKGTRQLVSGVLLDLLWYFACNAGRIISRQELSESVWAHSICTPPAEGGKTFDIHISRLRKLVEHDSSTPVLIQSVRGMGWRLTIEPVWHEQSSRSAVSL